MDYERINNMSMREIFSEAYNNTIGKLKKDPMDYITPSMKMNMTPANLKCMGACGISYFLAVMVFVSISDIFIAMPVVYEDTPEIITSRICMASYFIFNIMANFYMMCKKRGYFEGTKSPESSALLPGADWKHCIDCDHMAPPRTHHCVLCAKCILKRDHHCFFTGTCIGFENQRYFVVYCLYCAIGTGYSLFLMLQYLNMEHTHPSFSNFHHFLLPVTFFEWLFGYASFAFLYFVLMMWTSFCTCFCTAGIFIWQSFLVIKGSTTHEFWNARTGPKLTILQHIRSVFGPYWLLNFVVPLPSLQTPGDGIEWGSSKAT